MRYLFIVLLFIGISCKNTTVKNQKVQLVENEVIKDTIPNIYVVKTVFYSKDSLPITADFYEVNDKKPTILLCHQAGFSRGEYKDTAIKLNYLGYSCIAIDQRSGNEANSIQNETALKASERNLPTTYLDAKQDLEAAIDYVYQLNGNNPIILVGSSYSATLALLIGNSSEKVKVIVAFSPGEYFEELNIKEIIQHIEKPIFVTSSKKETPALEELVSLIDSNFVTHFKPNVEGIHGSRALWKSTAGNEHYWYAFKAFLKNNNPTN